MHARGIEHTSQADPRGEVGAGPLRYESLHCAQLPRPACARHQILPCSGRLLGRRVGHDHRVMAARVGEVTRRRDLDPVAFELDVEVWIGGEALGFADDGVPAGDQRGAGIGDRRIVGIHRCQRRGVMLAVGRVPLLLGLLELRFDLRGVDARARLASRERGRRGQRE